MKLSTTLERSAARPPGSGPRLRSLQQIAGRLRSSGLTPEPIILLGIAAWLACFWSGPLINDVGWQLWIGRQLNAGATLYGDILELNPPLWFWFGALIQRVAQWTGVAGPQLLTASIALLAGASIVLCRPLLPGTRERRAVGAALLLTLFLTSPFALAQREQITAITFLPYLALIVARAEQRQVRPSFAITVALFAAFGLALKHYFALAPLALEAWLILRHRRWALRPELVALAGAAFLYAVSILLFTPGYLSVIVPLIRTAYGGFDQHLVTQLHQPALSTALLAAGLLVLRRGTRPPLASAAVVAAGAFTAVYFIQAKAFAYHAVPMLAVALVALFAAVIPLHGERPRGAALLLALVGLGFAAAMPLMEGPARYDQPMAKATAELPRGSAVTMLSSSGVAAWPLVEERDLRWNSRHMMLWMLAPAWAERQEGRSTPGLQALASAVRREAALEIACKRPALVLVDTRYDRLAPDGSALTYFLEDPVFRIALSDYQRTPDTGYLQVFRRREGTGSPPQMCSTRP